MKKNIIKPYANKVILNQIKNKKLEDLELINEIDKFFIRKRGFVIDKPKKNEPVILLLSGGLDSTIVWAYLLDVYQLNVYPIFFKRGHLRVKFEEKSIDTFSGYFMKRYPLNFHLVKKIHAYIPPIEIRVELTKASTCEIGSKGQWRGIPAYSSLLFSYALQYANYLEIKKDLKIKKIFSAFMPSDGIGMRDETLTAIRSINQNLCNITDDYGLQIISLPLEKELGFYHDKSTFIKWAMSKKIPIDKTTSCIMWGKNQCGECFACCKRKQSFIEAGYKDLTVYGKQNFMIKELKKHWLQFLINIKCF